MSIGRLLDLSVRTMNTYQSAIDVATNNISNASSPDYTRQKVILASETAEGGSGAGVKIQDVLRVRNDILDMQVRKFQSSYSDATKRSEILEKLETLIDEPSDNGLSSYINAFFNSWEELSTNPNSIQLRLNVIQKAQQMSGRFKDIIDGFSEIQSVIQKEATVQVDQINVYVKNIHDLNQRIYESEVRGQKANELRDERDSQIDKLSELANITVHKNEAGALLVNIGGIYAADQTGFNQFELKIINGQMRLVSKNDSNAIAIVNSGEFGAIADIYSNKIVSYKTAYENLASNIVEEVNKVHRTGYSMITGGASNTEIPFFGELGTDGNIIGSLVEGQIKINSSILNNPKNLAVSSVAGNDGNSDIANLIAQLTSSKIPGLGEQTITEAYTSILGTIGLDKTLSDNSSVSGNMVLQNLKAQKASYSGVSLDEEMTNVMKYQRAYEASSKLIKIADELLQTLLNMF
jgi:flagellar hook-associated protein 1